MLRDGSLIWSGAAGAVAGDDPEATQYRIGSITKTMTAVLVLQCRDAGLLGLDDPLGRFLPGSGYAEATVGELLRHTSGMQAEPDGPWWERSPGVGAADLIAAHDGSGRVLPAGTAFHYSNLAFGLLGEVVARLRGQDWWTQVRDRLLVPLGMDRTTAEPEPGRHAQGFSVDHFAGTLTREPHTSTGAMAPAGQLWSTVPDLARWLAFLRGGHPDVLGARTLAEMALPTTAAPEYGLGLRLLEVEDRTFVGHTGSMPGFLATAFIDRDSGDGVIALANATTGIRTDALARCLVRGAEPGELEPWTPSAPPPVRAAELLGLWFWGNSAHEMRWSNGLLELRSLAPAELLDRYVLEPDRIRGVEGYHLGETVHVRRDATGTAYEWECATFRYTRTPYPDGP